MKIIGIIFILTGVLMTNSLISLKKKMNHCSSYASGKIISVESYTRFKGLRIRKYYIPTIEFTDNNITYKEGNEKHDCEFQKNRTRRDCTRYISGYGQKKSEKQ